ncbi:uncharacterized protein LOC5509612 [Nematostella vectensis]|uniref:uncharacterized protein LOC5509612 n=1 Tax=Nematostella vectensis TaxID=45351 RepID=UPI002076F8E1|nr:uncharacterized protein LOC5509612 [Nematostella vectensis]
MGHVARFLLVGVTLCFLHFTEAGLKRDRARKEALLGRLLKKRNVAESIKTCQHWNIVLSDDPSTADILVRLQNAAAVVKKISVALTCSTMRKLVEPKAHYQVKPSEVRDVLLSVSVLPAHYHYGNEVRKHRCLLSTWTEDSSSYVACKIEIPVWPNGLFYYKCNQYSIGQLTVTESTSRSGTKIKLLNTGEESLFMVNSTCEPAISTLTHTNKFKRLDSEEDWNLDFPASCDGRVGINYKGNCKVRVFHVCLKTITFIKEVQFPFKDGEIDECEHRKSEYAAYSLHWLPALLGVNDMATAVLVPVIVFLVMAILITLLIKFVMTSSLHGTSAARREFRHRFRSIFRARLNRFTSLEEYKKQKWLFRIPNIREAMESIRRKLHQMRKSLGTSRLPS